MTLVDFLEVINYLLFFSAAVFIVLGTKNYIEIFGRKDTVSIELEDFDEQAVVKRLREEMLLLFAESRKVSSADIRLIYSDMFDIYKPLKAADNLASLESNVIPIAAGSIVNSRELKSQKRILSNTFKTKYPKSQHKYDYSPALRLGV